MDSPARTLADFLRYTMFEMTAYRSGVFLDLRRPWEDDEAFKEVADLLAKVAQRTAVTAIGFHGDTQSGKLSRKAGAQVKMIGQAQKRKPVLVFDEPVSTFLAANDPLVMTSVIIVDDVSHIERDTDRTHGYAYLYDLHSIVQRRPTPTVNFGITGPWLKFFERREWEPTVLPDSMRRL